MHRLLSSKQRRKWFNLDVIRTTSKTEAVLQDIMQEFSLYQMVSKQSHSSNILDLLFTNDDTTISGVDVVITCQCATMMHLSILSTYPNNYQVRVKGGNFRI